MVMAYWQLIELPRGTCLDANVACQLKKKQNKNTITYLSNLDSQQYLSTNFSDEAGSETVGTWCNWWGNYLQLDQKSMAEYSDSGSPQNRFCGDTDSE